MTTDKNNIRPEEPASFKNPIDPDKIAENPGLLPYASDVSGAIIRPEDKGRIKGNAMTAMYEQTDRQLSQLKEQMATLLRQATTLQERKTISEKIYQAAMGFRPVMGHIYHVYEKKDGSCTLSLIAPDEWGARLPYVFLATVKLLYDHTWEILSGEPS